jgi:hypothetical protein
MRKKGSLAHQLLPFLRRFLRQRRNLRPALFWLGAIEKNLPDGQSRNQKGVRKSYPPLLCTNRQSVLQENETTVLGREQAIGARKPYCSTSRSNEPNFRLLLLWYWKEPWPMRNEIASPKGCRTSKMFASTPEAKGGEDDRSGVCQETSCACEIVSGLPFSGVVCQPLIA